VDRLVVAGAQVGQQRRVQPWLAAGLGLLNGGVRLAQHGSDLTGPGLPLRVQVQHALGVADDVGAALLHAGKPGVELVPAGVVIADQVAGEPVEHTQVGDRLLRPGAGRGVPRQTLVGSVRRPAR
jgi:hypothetical protein